MTGNSNDDKPDAIKTALLVFEVLALIGAISIIYWNVAAYCHRLSIGRQFECMGFITSIPHGLAVVDLDQVGLALLVVAFATCAGLWKESWTWTVLAMSGLIGVLASLIVGLNYGPGTPSSALLGLMLFLTFPSVMWSSAAESCMPQRLRQIREKNAERWKWLQTDADKRFDEKARDLTERAKLLALISGTAVLGLIVVVVLSLYRTNATSREMRMSAALNAASDRPLAVLRSDSAGIVFVDEQGDVFWRALRAIDSLSPTEFKVIEGGKYEAVMLADLPSNFQMISMLILSVVLVSMAVIWVAASTVNKHKRAKAPDVDSTGGAQKVDSLANQNTPPTNESEC